MSEIVAVLFSLGEAQFAPLPADFDDDGFVFESDFDAAHPDLARRREDFPLFAGPKRGVVNGCQRTVRRSENGLERQVSHDGDGLIGLAGYQNAEAGGIGEERILDGLGRGGNDKDGLWNFGDDRGRRDQGRRG